MGKISVFLADSQFLVLEGLRSLIRSNPKFEMVGEARTRGELLERIPTAQPSVLLADYTSEACSLKDIALVIPFVPSIRVLAITPHLDKRTIQSALDTGICSYVLKDCGEEEIIDAIEATSRGERFFCGKVLDTLVATEKNAKTNISTAACEALNISERELEIICLIAEGNSNKQIAEQLFLSQHTVNTHRKNIMSKLGVNNTAGIVLFAVKEHLISPNKYLFSQNQ